jgi:hypothetical protein
LLCASSKKFQYFGNNPLPHARNRLHNLWYHDLNLAGGMLQMGMVPARALIKTTGSAG